jgi:hypothetical protein
MKKIFQFVIIALFLVYTVGCAGVSTPKIENLNSAKKTIGTRILVQEQCPSEIKPKALPVFAIITAVAPFLIEHGVGLAADYLKKEASKYEATYSAREVASLYKKFDEKKAKSTIGCLTAARGLFGNEGKRPEYPDELGLADDKENPYFYLETKVIYSSDGNRKYFRLVPLKLEFRKTAAKRGVVKDLVITHTFRFPKGSVKDKTDISFTTEPINIESVREGTKLEGKLIEHLATDWHTLPPPPEKFLTAAEKGEKSTPFSVTIIIHETDKGKGAALAQLISKSIEDNKADISKFLSELIKKKIGGEGSGSDK